MTDKKKVRESDQNYGIGGKGPAEERGAITKNAVSNPAGGNAWPFGSGKPQNKTGGDKNMPSAGKQSTGYAYGKDGSKSANPAMNRRDSVKQNAGAGYAYGKDGTKTANPAMNEEEDEEVDESMVHLPQAL